jgi:GT2 family glycosyltransferase/tetratricopeptide (TPR) repeat protein
MRQKPTAISLADRARDAGQWELAIQFYRRALEQDPLSSPIWVQYGHALKESGELRDPDKLAQAELAYRRAVALHPGAADPYLQLGHVLKLQGRKEEAEAAYLRAAVLDGSAAEPLRELNALGWSKAQAAELQALTRPQDAPTAINLSADKIPLADMPQQAVAIPDLGSSEGVGRNESVISRANRARDAGGWELAAQLYRQALDQDPDNPPIWVQYGHALKESGQLREPEKLAQAERAYRKALSLAPEVADSHLQLGHVLKLQGKFEEARAAYLRAVALDPSMPDPLRELSGSGWSDADAKYPANFDCVSHTLHVASASGDFLLDPAELQNAQLIAQSGLFDPAWYRAQNADVAATGMDPLAHYLTLGSAEGRWPNSLFDPAWYRAQNPDVAASGTEPLAHYIADGCAEGRSPREFLPRRQTNPLDSSYLRWVAEYDTLDNEDRKAIHAHIAELAKRPLISVIVPVYNTEEKYLREMIQSVLRQIYPYWELCIADDASTEPHVVRVLQEFAARDQSIKFVRRETNGHISAATNSALDLAMGEFVALLDHDDLLAETALYELAVELDAHPDADVVYSDSDNIDDSGQRSVPYFKTDWNPDLMLGHNMVSHLGVYRRSLVEDIGRLRPGFEGSQDYDLLLRAADASGPSRIRHIPAVLYHWRRNASQPSFSEKSLERCVVSARRAIREHLERTGVEAHIAVPPKCPSWTRVVYSLPPERPLVSIIVPTRDRADLLAICADGVLTRTDYQPLELIIVDNDSKEPATQRLFARLAGDCRVRIIQHPGSFNYSAINNHAVNEARGEIVVLMNNDVDVISPMWLEEMVSHALRPEIGAVGAKLLYPNGLVQHAGVVLGVGHGAGHSFAGSPRDDVGRWGFLWMVRQVSAVTAACMALRRALYLQVGGMDDINFPVAFNDVDLCLRIGKRGYGILWTPYAELYHRESETRGADTDIERSSRLERDAEQLRQRWGEVLDRDPFYNQNCSLALPNFEPGFPPRRRKPWLAFNERANPPQAEERADLPPTEMSRADTLLSGVERSARIIEIGPSFSPIAPKADGWSTSTVDHATRDALIDKYRGHPGVDVDKIEEVDFVWSSGSITDVVPSDRHGTFDAFIASHVIEHTTDLIGFLETAATLLAPRGVVILAVPDKRYCFDYFRPLTTTGQVLEAHAARRSRHTRRIAFDHAAYAVHHGRNGAWGQAPLGALDFYSLLEEAGNSFSSFSADPGLPYIDFHAWQFIPASFELLMLELACLGQSDWRIERITPAIGCEFHVWLRRGGKAAAAALTGAEVNRRRLALLNRMLLETRDQINFAFAISDGSSLAAATVTLLEPAPTSL